MKFFNLITPAGSNLPPSIIKSSLKPNQNGESKNVEENLNKKPTDPSKPVTTNTNSPSLNANGEKIQAEIQRLTESKFFGLANSDLRNLSEKIVGLDNKRDIQSFGEASLIKHRDIAEGKIIALLKEGVPFEFIKSVTDRLGNKAYGSLDSLGKTHHACVEKGIKPDDFVKLLDVVEEKTTKNENAYSYFVTNFDAFISEFNKHGVELKDIPSYMENIARDVAINDLLSITSPDSKTKIEGWINKYFQ